MRSVVRPLTRAGEYSHYVVLPKSWVEDLGYPKKVRIIIGRKRLIVYPEEGDGDGRAKQ